jgi:DNA-binding MarR family transcriptional regulator
LLPLAPQKVQTLQTLRFFKLIEFLDLFARFFPHSITFWTRSLSAVLKFAAARIIVRHMNYSDVELSAQPVEDEVLIDASVQLLPVIAKALFSSISGLGNAFGLTPAQVKVLLQLGTRRQMTVGEIAAALDCSMPSASELVDRLVDGGHLLRASDPTDRRRVLIAATPATQQISAHLRQLREAQVRYALDQLEPEERPIFVKSLQALVAGLAHTQKSPSLAGCPGAPAACVDPSAANPDSPAASAPAADVSASRVIRKSLSSPPLRGSD